MGGEMEEDDASRLECLLAGVNDGWGLLESHMDEYSLTCKEAAQKLRRIWKESGLGEAEQAEELGGITEATSRVWGNAVERAESQVAALRKRLEESVREICEIRAELCMDEVGSRSVESLVGGGASVRDKYNGAKELLEEWKGIREARMAEFARLLDELDRMRARLGMGKSGGGGAQQIVFSHTGVKQVREELDNLHSTRQRREMDLEAVLSRLRKICIELGENDVEIAETAHPSLRYYREALPDQFHMQYRRPNNSSTEIRTDLRPEDIELDLTDETFWALEKKIEDTERLKTVREQQATELSQVLHNLWKVLGIEASEVDRGIHSRLLEGPTRLHSKSIDKCMNEVTRLEKAKAARLQSLIEERIQELEELYKSTHMEMPDLSLLLPAEGGDGQVASGGLVSDALGKLIKMVEDVTELAEKRAGMIATIGSLEGCKYELSWLFAYEQDEDRYKGRDSNRNLQKALKVGKLRDKMPAMIEKLRYEMAAWEEDENAPFMFEGVNYKEELEKFAVQIESSMASRRGRGTKPAPKGPSPSSSKGSSSRLSRASLSRTSVGAGSQILIAEEVQSTGRNAKSLHLSYRLQNTPKSSTKNPLCSKRNGSLRQNHVQEKSNLHGGNEKRRTPVLRAKSTTVDVANLIDRSTNSPKDYESMVIGDWESSRGSPQKASEVFMASGDWKTIHGNRGMYCFDQE